MHITNMIVITILIGRIRNNYQIFLCSLEIKKKTHTYHTQIDNKKNIQLIASFWKMCKLKKEPY